MDKIDLPVPVSFEFFPPNTPVGSDKLKTVVQELAVTGNVRTSPAASGTPLPVRVSATRHGVSV